MRLSADARSVFLAEPGVPGRIDRLDVATGRRTPWKVLRPDDGAGVFLVDSFQVTGAGEAYAYSYQRFLQDLILVRGVR